MGKVSLKLRHVVLVKSVTHGPSQWVYPTTIQTADDFQTSDEIPFGISPNASLFATIKKQTLKEGLSRKSNKERITAKSAALSERLGESLVLTSFLENKFIV